MWYKSIGFLLHRPEPRRSLKLRYMLLTRIRPGTLWSIGWHSLHWAKLSSALLWFFNHRLKLIKNWMSNKLLILSVCENCHNLPFCPIKFTLKWLDRCSLFSNPKRKSLLPLRNLLCFVFFPSTEYGH